MRKSTVLVADGQAAVRADLCRILHQNFEVVGAVGDGRALTLAARTLHPDVIVTEITMPEVGGIDAIHRIRQADRIVKIVFLGPHADMVCVIGALSSGGSAYVLKDSAPAELVTAIHEVLFGRVYVSPSIVRAVYYGPEAREARSEEHETPRLSARQREVLRSIAIGCTMKETAAALNISTKTVEFHKYHLMRQVGARSVAELTRLAIKLRMLAP